MRRFFLYHEDTDKGLAQSLCKFFKTWVRNGKMKISSCYDMPAGVVKEEWLVSELESAEVVLFVVTSNLLGEDFFYDKFTPVVLSKRNNKGCMVIPVIFSSNLLVDTKFGKLQPVPKVRIDQYPSPDNGFEDAAEQLRDILEQEKFDKGLAVQGSEVENLKSALSNFNYYTQLSPEAVATAPSATFSSAFNILIIKGGKRSGHELLARRWRDTVLKPIKYPEICTLNLSSTYESPTQIGMQIWDVLKIPAYIGEENKFMEQLADKLLQRLQNEALVIRLDDFLPSVHPEWMDLFFIDLSKALEVVKAQKTNLPALQSLWFYLFYRFKEEEMHFALSFPAQVVLPSVSPVSKEDFESWRKGPSNDALCTFEKYLEIDYELGKILDLEEPKKNEVLDVLDRICQSVYAKEFLYDQYIATLK